MRILLDECVHAGLKTAFPGHSVKTVAEMAWRGLGDRQLLTHAQDSFDVFVTIDRRLEHQQNLGLYNLGFVIARVPNNKLDSYRPLFRELLDAATQVRMGEVIHVPT